MRYTGHVRIYRIIGGILLGFACIGTDAGRVYADEPVNSQNSPGFPVGEVLLFRLKWGIVPVGTARIVSEWTDDTPPAVRVRVHVRSNAFLDRIYRIDDRVESVAVATNMLPIRFEKEMNEGGVIRRDMTTFDRQVGRVMWSNMLEKETRAYDAPHDVRDILSMMYALRSVPFAAGETQEYVVAGDEGPAPVQIAVREQRKYKHDRYGEIPALHMRPKVSGDALFLGRVPRDLWISAEVPHVLLSLSVDAPIGQVHLLLDAIEGADSWPAAQ